MTELESPKIFSLDQARRALPLVKRIAADLHSVVNELATIEGGVGLLYGASNLDDMPEGKRDQAGELILQITALAGEIGEIGAEIKGFHPILVDFHSIRDGEEICLCWSHTEDDITHWHTLADGFKGRKPL